LSNGKTTENFKYSISIYYYKSMARKTNNQVLHYPRLDTVLKVEAIIKKAKAPLSKNGIDRMLDRQIMRPTLNLILAYLEESGKIAVLKEGIVWVYLEDASKKLKARLKKGVRVI